MARRTVWEKNEGSAEANLGGMTVASVITPETVASNGVPKEVRHFQLWGAYIAHHATNTTSTRGVITFDMFRYPDEQSGLVDYNTPDYRDSRIFVRRKVVSAANEVTLFTVRWPRVVVERGQVLQFRFTVDQEDNGSNTHAISFGYQWVTRELA